MRKKHSQFRQFFFGYLDCALWASTDNSNEQGGDPLDKNYGPEDISFGSKLKMARDCKDFLNGNKETLDEYGLLVDAREIYTNMECAGHDFWLTRNRHGAGFWDRGIGKVGDKLSEAAHVYGSQDLYVGDDNQLHVN